MPTITTPDGTQIYYKDWGPRNSQPVVFHHGWPPSPNGWGTQISSSSVRAIGVVAHDRRGHGRSSQVSDGHDMGTTTQPPSSEHLDLRNAIHVGHSAGGGEAPRYVACHGQRNGTLLATGVRRCASASCIR